LVKVNELWGKVYPYLAAQVAGVYGRANGRVLELGPFAGGMSCALAVSHQRMNFTIVCPHEDYLAYVKQDIVRRNLTDRMNLMATTMEKLPFADGSFDLVLLRGAFFFIMDCPLILHEIYRVLALGGVAFVGGGYGENTPLDVISPIAEESRVLNDKLGRRRITLEQLRALVRSQNLEQMTHITEEGGVWIKIHKRPYLVEKCATSLSLALGLSSSENIALVGGGGKTSLMFCLARELANGGKTVISTTTTHIAKPSTQEAPCLIMESDENVLLERLLQVLQSQRHVTLALACDDDDKLKGLPQKTLDRIYNLQLVNYVINEADGAGGKSVKAPRHNEPVVPTTTTLVVALVGMDVFNASLSHETAFRLDFIERLTGLQWGGSITEEVLATLLTQSQGIIQNTTPDARIIPFLNKSDMVSAEAVTSVASAVLARRHKQINSVVAGSLRAQLPEFRIFRSQL